MFETIFLDLAPRGINNGATVNELDATIILRSPPNEQSRYTRNKPHSGSLPQCCKRGRIDPTKLFISLLSFASSRSNLRSARCRENITLYMYKCPNARRTIDAHHIRKPVRVRRGAHPLAKLHTPRLYIASDEISSVLLIAPFLALSTRFLRRQMFYCLGGRGRICVPRVLYLCHGEARIFTRCRIFCGMLSRKNL